MFEDMNWWGMLAMPVGVALCFGPVIVAWAMSERSDDKASQKSRKERR